MPEARAHANRFAVGAQELRPVVFGDALQRREHLPVPAEIFGLLALGQHGGHLDLRVGPEMELKI